MKNFNFWETNFNECCLAVFKITAMGNKLDYEVWLKVTNKWPKEYKSKLWVFSRMSLSRQELEICRIINKS